MSEVEAATGKKRRPPAALFALGHAGLPVKVEAEGAPGGVAWEFVKLYKHDFFAATGLYRRKGAAVGGTDSSDIEHSPEAANDLAVLKIQRVHSYFGFPMRWLGRMVANHEIAIYQRLQGIAGIPAFFGRVGKTGFLHAFIPGTDLHAELPLSPVFFEQLRALFEALHARRVAYVDANKRENILYGDDGRPWLIDFQISYSCQRKWGGGLFWRPGMLRRFIRADWYHFYKHKTRLIPEACGPEDFAKAEDRGFFHRLHRRVSRPLILLRRRMLSRYDLSNTR